MRQKSIGEVLRAARENRGWTFVDVQRQTKIQARHLQALEHNDFESISDPEYARLFLKSYGEVLELDTAVLLEAFASNNLIRYYEEGEEEEFQSELKRGYKVRKKQPSYLPLFYLLLVAGGIISFVGYMVHRYYEQQAPLTSPSTYVVASSAVSQSSSSETEEKTETTSSAPVIPKEKLTPSASGEEWSVTVPSAVFPLTVQLTSKGETSWVSLTETELAGGVTLSPDQPKATATLTEGTKEAVLVLGVVQGIEVSLADQLVDMTPITSQPATIRLVFE